MSSTDADTHQGSVVMILGPVEQDTLIRDSRQVCVINGWVCDEPDSPDNGILRRLNGAEIA